MHIIVKRIARISNFFIPIITIIAVFISLLSTFQLTYDKKAEKKGNEIIFELISNNFSKGLITDKEDIVLLINSVSREYGSNYSLSPILEDYIVYVSKNKETNTLSNENYILLKNIIMIENQEKPFNDIPDEERRLLININASVDNDDLDTIKNNVKELSSVLSTRNKIYQKTELINRWSVPLAVIGIILTIVFGLAGLIVSIKSGINIKSN